MGVGIEANLKQYLMDAAKKAIKAAKGTPGSVAQVDAIYTTGPNVALEVAKRVSPGDYSAADAVIGGASKGVGTGAAAGGLIGGYVGGPVGALGAAAVCGALGGGIGAAVGGVKYQND